MGIFDALTAAVAGLQAQSFALQNISGNIANSQTTGYKETNTAFQDLVNQAAINLRTPDGVTASSVATNTVQGSITSTSVATDMAINGDGFFVVSKPTGFVDNQPTFSGINDYTRAGDFTMNNNGNLVNSAGYYLMGIPVDSTTGNPLGSVPERSWRDYERRWRTRRAVKRREVAAPLWLGAQPIQGKTVLLAAEQGLGDTINFARYAPLVAALGATVILDVPAPLKEIAASVPGVALVLEDGESVPPVDFYCPLMSLPLVFQTEIGTIPASIPYIRPHAESPAKWRARLPRNGRLRVGLCWAGSGAHLNDHNRSIAIERFAGILSLSNLDFISVQKEVSEPQAAFLRQYHVIQLGQDFENFADTAAALAELDLLISVDTSVAHLAGAMGTRSRCYCLCRRNGGGCSIAATVLGIRPCGCFGKPRSATGLVRLSSSTRSSARSLRDARRRRHPRPWYNSIESVHGPDSLVRAWSFPKTDFRFSGSCSRL
ncbi:MAG: flagellar hook-basal body complex protein [Xanthobacteraceae bacterium]